MGYLSCTFDLVRLQGQPFWTPPQPGPDCRPHTPHAGCEGAHTQSLHSNRPHISQLHHVQRTRRLRKPDPVTSLKLSGKEPAGPPAVRTHRENHMERAKQPADTKDQPSQSSQLHRPHTGARAHTPGDICLSAQRWPRDCCLSLQWACGTYRCFGTNRCCLQAAAKFSIFDRFEEPGFRTCFCTRFLRHRPLCPGAGEGCATTETQPVGPILISRPHHSGHPVRSCGACPAWRPHTSLPCSPCLAFLHVGLRRPSPRASLSPVGQALPVRARKCAWAMGPPHLLLESHSPTTVVFTDNAINLLGAQDTHFFSRAADGSFEKAEWVCTLPP